MRYAVLADVHGNFAALVATVERLSEFGVDRWLCAGDIVGYGPHPNECVELLGELGAQCVAGNHELMVLGRLSQQRAGRLARQTTPWTQRQLRPDCLAYLAGLPQVLQADEVVVVHASLSDPERYVQGRAQATAELGELQRLDLRPRVLVLGHTHRAAAYDVTRGALRFLPGQQVPFGPDESVLLNPGSVGQSRESERVPHARAMVLDLDAQVATFFREPYDVAACRGALTRARLPQECLHLPPRRLRAASKRVARVLTGAQP